MNRAFPLANWGDGSVLVVAGTLRGRRHAELDFSPVSTALAAASRVGDGATLMKNALLYDHTRCGDVVGDGGSSCPLASRWCKPEAIVATSEQDALAACTACYGTCEAVPVVGGQCTGTAYGPSGSTDPLRALYGHTAGCEGLIFEAGSPFPFLGSWAP